MKRQLRFRAVSETAVSGGALAASLGLLAPPGAITLLDSFAPGSSTDLVARMLAPLLASQLCTVVVVRNGNGRSWTQGIDVLSNAPADGCTLGLATVSTLRAAAVVHHIKRDAKARALVPIGTVASVPSVLGVCARLPVRTLRDLVAMVPTSNTLLRFATRGVGTLGHARLTRLMRLTGLPFEHVGQDGSTRSYFDALVRGDVHLIFESLPTLLPYLRDGSVRALAVADTTRSVLLPDTPTFSELGLPAVSDAAWFGLVAPPGTDAAAVEVLQRALRATVLSAPFAQITAAQGIVPLAGPPEGLAERTLRATRPATSGSSSDVQDWASSLVDPAGHVEVAKTIVACDGRTNVVGWHRGETTWVQRHDVLLAFTSGSVGFTVEVGDGDAITVSSAIGPVRAALIHPLTPHRLVGASSTIVVVGVNVTHPSFVALKRLCTMPVTVMDGAVPDDLWSHVVRTESGRIGLGTARALAERAMQALGCDPCARRENDSRLAWALRRVQTKLDIEFDQVAREMGLSTARLSKVFSDEVGLPFRSVVAWQRLMFAVQLAVLEPDLPLGQIAHLTGYTDSGHMLRAFMSHLGDHPSALRDTAQVRVVGLRSNELLRHVRAQHRHCPTCREFDRDRQARARLGAAAQRGRRSHD